MATKKHTARPCVEEGVNRPGKFFSLNANYLIDPASKTEDIGDDIACMFEVLVASIQAVVDATAGDQQVNTLAFSTRYLAEQSQAMFLEYFSRTEHFARSTDCKKLAAAALRKASGAEA